MEVKCIGLKAFQKLSGTVPEILLILLCFERAGALACA